MNLAARCDLPHPVLGVTVAVASDRRARDARESELMAAYVAGNRKAFETLFDLLAPRLLAFFRRTVADRALTDDMLQATFERLHNARARYRPGSPLAPWLFTIAANVRTDLLRRRHRLPRGVSEEELDQLAAAQASFEEPVLGGDEVSRERRVREAVEKLPASQRIVVHLHRFEELSYAEIGLAVGASEGAVRVRASRAYERLRTLLLPILEEEQGR